MSWAQIADNHYIAAHRIIDVRLFEPDERGYRKSEWGVSCTIDVRHEDAYVQRTFATREEALASVERILAALETGIE